MSKFTFESITLLCSLTHGERSLIVHVGHGNISGCRIHHEDLLIVTQLELSVEGVNHWNRTVGLLEGDGNQEPFGQQQSSGLKRPHVALLSRGPDFIKCN